MPGTDTAGKKAPPLVPGGRAENLFAVFLALIFMVGPVFFIQWRYEDFVSQHGQIRAGAAGATLLLAVILRTVSRTILRTVIRASARSGLKVTTKGVLRSGVRAGSKKAVGGGLSRFLGSALLGDAARPTEPKEIRKKNIKSLVGGSALIYASWVIVVGLGQPFAELKTAEAKVQAEAADRAELDQRLFDLEARIPPEVQAWKLGQLVDEARAAHKARVTAIANETNPIKRQKLEADLVVSNSQFIDATAEFASTLARAKGRISPPEKIDKGEEEKIEMMEPTAAPYPGSHGWSSPVIWLGGLLGVLPMWLIYFCQSLTARRLQVPLHHETGVDGGIIQLYFAGAFSFMPLTSDVVVEGNASQKAKVSLVGLLVPTIVALVLYNFWKNTGGTDMRWLLAADMILIYPIVQVFPLSPLDGAQLWNWRRWVWCLVFTFVMSAFVFTGSEGLKNVI